jgi:histone H3/H4
MTDAEDELTIPRASLNKMMKELLPNVRISNEAKELVMNCCTEFVHVIASRANEVCNQNQKKTIMPDHVLGALNGLGFGDMVGEAEEVLKGCKEMQAQRRKHSTRLENLVIPEEELLRQQQELFAKAREEQLQVETQQWQQIQAEVQKKLEEEKRGSSSSNVVDEDDDYC